MKKHFNFKSMYRAAFVALCLMTVGVGDVWGGNKRVYCYWGYVDWWDNDGCKMCLHAWGSSTLSAADFEMKASDVDKVLYYDLDDSYTSLCFFRAPSVDVSKKTNQTVDITIGTNNRWDIWTNTSGDNQEVAAQRWVNGAAIDGLLDPKNPYKQAFNGDGEFTATLAAHSTYEFKVLDNITHYGLNEDVLTSSVSEQTLNTSGYQVRLCTAGAGNYKFTWDSENKKLSVEYPDVDHPNIDYCYVIKYDSWNPDYDLHVWGGTSTYVAEWNPNSTISGTTAPGVDLTNYVTIGDTKYFYIAPGNFTDFVVTKNNNASDRSYDVKSADGYGKRRYWKDETDGWVWNTFSVHIALNDLTPTTHVAPTYLDVAFNSDVLTDLTTVPTKTHYDFGGFYTGYDEVNEEVTGVQVINAAGEWIASVDDYTDASKHWIHAGMSTTLYAKWTQHPYDITLAVDPTDAGTVQIGGNAETSVNAHWVTESAEITAVPASPAYIFKEWQFSKTGEEYDVFVSDDKTYHSTDATIKIKASHNGTLTAIFEPRYCLVGSLLNNDLAGMPGWSDYDNSATFFTVNSITPSLNLTCARTLHPNSTYKFEVHDRKAGANYGYGDGTYVLNAESSQSFNVSNADVRINTTAYGTYTFTITEITETDGKYYPTVTVARPANPRRVYFGWGHAEIDAIGTVNSGNTGGSLAIQTTESDDSHFDITESGQWVANGCSVTYTATAQTGYTLTWYSENTYTTAFDKQPAASWIHSSISDDDNVYAKFTEVSTTVTLANDGHGKVQINSTDQTSTTCGVTTTRQLNAVPNSGYTFSSWSKTGSDISLSATNTNPTTLTGGGSGASSQSVTANFSANNYTITLDDKHGGTTSASVTYDATSLTSITHATFSGWTLLGYWNTDGNKVIEADGDIVANVVNYTGSSGEWNYANNVTLYAHWSRSITLDKKEGSSSGSVTVNYDESTTASLSPPSRTGYHVEGYYADNDRTHKVMEANGTLVNYTGYVESGKWVHATATTLYTKWAPNEYTVTLDPREVESGDEGTPSVTVYYETSTNMTSAITKPTKEHYTFLGYYTGYDDVNKVVTGSKLIDDNGNWIKDVTGFTGHDGDNPTWVYVGGHTLYADWTETMYPVAIAISPAGAGNVQVSGKTVTEVTAGYATHSPEMTPVANAGWVFKEWQVSSANLQMDLINYHSNYQKEGTNAMKVNATAMVKPLPQSLNPDTTS